MADGPSKSKPARSRYAVTSSKARSTEPDAMSPTKIEDAAQPDDTSIPDRSNEKEKPYKFVVRLPISMRDRIAEAASHYRRSMNSEIIARLHQSFSGLPDAGPEQAVEPPLHPHLERILRPALDQREQQLISGFRRLGREKQAALLKLLR